MFKTRKDSLFLTNSAAAWQFLQNLSQTDDSVMLALNSSVADGQPERAWGRLQRLPSLGQIRCLMQRPDEHFLHSEQAFRRRMHFKSQSWKLEG